VWCDVGPPCAHAGHHGVKVHPRLADDANTAAGPGLAGRARGAEERFRRYAAGVETIAAQTGALDQRDARPESCRSGRTNQPGGAATDHYEVVEWLRGRVAPVRRPDARHQPAVIFIVPQNAVHRPAS
jgi:hypothetical protein